MLSFLDSVYIILSLAYLSGTPRQISLSKRPVLLKPGSRDCGFEVVAITYTSSYFIESKQEISYVTILFSISLLAFFRLEAIESISSIKIMLG